MFSILSDDMCLAFFPLVPIQRADRKIAEPKEVPMQRADRGVRHSWQVQNGSELENLTFVVFSSSVSFDFGGSLWLTALLVDPTSLRSPNQIL